MLDEWSLETYKDYLLIPVKNSNATSRSPETYGFTILNPDLSLLIHDVSEYKGQSKALTVAKHYINLHLARMEALQ